MNDGQKPGSFSEAVKNVAGAARDGTLIFAALVYYTGYQYLRAYYDAWGINIWSFDVPVYTVLVYAGKVIREHLGHVVLRVLVLALVVAVVQYCATRFDPQRCWRSWYANAQIFIVVLWCGAFFLAASVYAKNTATLEVYRGLDNSDWFGSVFLQFHDNSAKKYPVELLRLNNKRQLRMLVDTHDFYVVLAPPVAYSAGIPQTCMPAARCSTPFAVYRKVFRVRADDVTVVVNANRPDPPDKILL